MNISYFIAKRIVSSSQHKKSISAPIVKIAIVAVAISVLMMIVAVSTGVGFQQKIREKITSFHGHVLVSNYDNNQSNITLEPLSLQQDFYPKFSVVSQVNGVYPFATKAGVIRTKETFEGVVYKGVGLDYNWQYIQDYITDGRLPKFLDNQLSNEVLVSEYLANRLKVKVGDKLTMYFLKENTESLPNIRGFEIVGIFNSGFREFDQTYLIGDLRQVQRLNKWSKEEVGAFELYIDDFEKIDQVSKEVYDYLPSTLNAVAITEKYYNIFEWLKLFDFNIYVILVIMLIVAVINMIVVLLVLILERSQMIGVLKSIGASNWAIRKIFLYNATYIVLKGLLYGNLLAISLLFLQKYFKIVALDPSQYYVSYVPVDINWFYILAINLVMIIWIYLVLILPSYLITKISPIKVLRFQ